MVEKNSKSYLNKDNVYYEEDDNINQAQIPNINNTSKKYYDTYTNVQNNNQSQNVVVNNTKKNVERKYHDKNLKRIKEEFNLDYKDNNNFNNTYPIKGQKVYKTENLINNNTIKNQDENIDQRNNRFKQEQNYNNINVNYNMNVSQNQNMNNIVINNKVNNNQLKDNDIQIIEPQKPKNRRPVYKIPPSKKRAISHGKSLGFIDKYYDENFILEEDNEDIGSDSENKKKNNKRLKKIFREVINIKRLIPQWQELKRINNENNRMEHNENIIIRSEEQNNIENTNKESNINNNENVNIQQRNQNMRLSHLRFSLETSNSEENKIKKNIDNNIDNDYLLNSNNNEENKDNEIDNNINIDGENNNIIKSVIIPNTQIESELEEHSQNELESKVIVDSNMSGPKDTDSVIEKKSLLDERSNNNSKNNDNNQNHYKKLINIDINSSSNNPTIIKESNMSINPDFYDPKETNIKDSIKKSNISLEENKNKEIDEDKRISLNIAGHDLDKYFEKEGVNKRDSNQMEVSNSLKTINLNDDDRNSRISRISLTEEQKDNLKNSQAKSTLSNNGDNTDINEGNQLLTLDDALKGSVNIPENIKDFVSKNNELYNNDNDNENIKK